jgi:C4-dicarboxylate transporter, DctQ subunit
LSRCGRLDARACLYLQVKGRSMASMAGRMGKAFDRILDGAVVLAGVIVVWQTLSVTINTGLRYLFNSPISGVENFTEYGILWITFLAAAWLLKMNRHIRADIFISHLSAKAQAVIELASTVIGIALCLIMLYYGTMVTADLWASGEKDAFKIQILPRAVPVAIIPFGFLLLTIQYCRKFFSDLEHLRFPNRNADSKSVTTNEETI